MDAFADFFPNLLVLAALLLAAMGLAPVAMLLRLPVPAAFLLVGVVAGALGWAPIDGLDALTLEQIGAIALYGVLFQGGLATGFTAWRRQARPILLLGLPGTGLTALLLALVAHYALGLGWGLSSLVAVALCPTDPAAVYSTLRGGGTSARARTILEGESGFNDPVGISLMVVVVSFLATDDATVGDGIVRFVEELGIGLVGGVIGGAAVIGLLRRTARIDDTFQTVAVLVLAVLVGAGTATLHGSGFLAVYICGLLASDVWARQDGSQHSIPEAVSTAAEPLLFGLLGAVFASTVDGKALLYGIVLTAVTVIVVRPLVTVVCLARTPATKADRLVVSIGGLKGAVPLLLAAYPALEGLDEYEQTAAIVLVATAASIVAQGLALSIVARRRAAFTES